MQENYRFVRKVYCYNYYNVFPTILVTAKAVLSIPSYPTNIEVSLSFPLYPSKSRS
jgi:hypothetical protein